MQHPLKSSAVVAAVLLTLTLAAGCGSDDDAAPTTDDTTAASDDVTTATTEATDTESTSETTDPTTETTGTDDDPAETGVPGGNVTPDNQNPEDPPGTGTIPARLTIDGDALEAEACEVVGGAVRVRAGDGVTDPGVVVDGGVDDASMTLLNLTGGVDATTAELTVPADDANTYIGTFDASETDGIESIEASYNVGVLPCPDNPAS